ncbi:MAG: glycosyltransferase family 2 protein, partial [Muribaculaceae bacterium]|nr:glycosyltransferase family 2 protein [Muribaculaceae bacterium]
IFVTKVLKAIVWLTFHVNVTDANTPFRLMKVESIKPLLDIIPQDFFLSNVALSALAVKKGLKTRWLPITFKPRQGGVNSINMKRIFKIGRKAVKDFIVLNRMAAR